MGILCQLCLSLHAYFNCDDQALHGFAKFFQKSSDEEHEHGIKLMEYQAKRGGRVVFQDIAKPSSSEWGTPCRPWRLLLSWRKLSTRACKTFTGLVMERATLISVTSWRLNTLVSRLKESSKLET